MNIYLKDLELAFRNVHIDEYNCIALKPNGETYNQQPENNFSTKIIANLSEVMKRTENTDRYYNLRLHFDTLKYRINISPDIVLHESPENQERQIFLCEVKIDSNANLNEDLNKLKLAISNELNFESAVMIVANKTLISTQTCIIKKFSNDEDENLKKLFLFNSIPIDGELKFTIKSFKEIINMPISKK